MPEDSSTRYYQKDKESLQESGRKQYEIMKNSIEKYEKKYWKNMKKYYKMSKTQNAFKFLKVLGL